MIRSVHSTVLSIAAGAAILSATPALSADITMPSYTEPMAAPSKFDLAFGVTFTTHYMFRGTQVESPAVQGYVEASYDILYAGIWSSNIPGGAEVDFYVGIAPELGDLAFDFGYAHYIYPGTGTADNGEFYAAVDYSATDKLTLGTAIYYDPFLDGVYVEGNGSLALPHDLELSAAIGRQWYNPGTDWTTWNAGISWTYNDFMTVDLRYHDADIAPARFVASLSFDTSISSIRARGY